MNFKRIIARNVIWNWAGMIVYMLVGFLLAPYLVNRLGLTVYGVWILLGTLTNYFGLMDLGIRGSVGRYVAFHRARNDRDGVNAILSTATVILCGLGVVTLALTFGALDLFFWAIKVPEEQVAATRVALVITGINLALLFPLSVFEGALWGLQRFDLLNVIDIPVALVRTGLTFWLVQQGYGLIGLAVLGLVTTAASGAARAALCFWVEPTLRLAPALLRRSAVRNLYGYGVWSLLLNLASQVNSQVSLLIIGAWLSVEAVTPFSLAGRLVGYASAFLVAATGVLTPFATTLYAEERHHRQRQLFLEGGKYCTALALFFLALFLLLGRPLVRLWLGPALDETSTLLVILALGAILPMAQWVTNSMLLGMSRHRFMALVSLAECVIAVVLAAVLVRPWGLIGVAVAFAVCGGFCRGFIQMVYGCWLTEVSLRRYLWQALGQPLLAAALPTAGLVLVLRSWQPQTWPQLLLITTAFGTCYLLMTAPALIGWDRLRSSFAGLRTWRGVGVVQEDAA